MRVIVCGSRGWRNFRKVYERLRLLPSDAVIIVGYDPERRRPRGADAIAYGTAHGLGLAVETHPAGWEEFGKPAGFIRNAEMARSGADLCLAFWDGHSGGTADMMARAREQGIPVEEIL